MNSILPGADESEELKPVSSTTEPSDMTTVADSTDVTDNNDGTTQPAVEDQATPDATSAAEVEADVAPPVEDPPPPVETETQDAPVADVTTPPVEAETQAAPLAEDEAAPSNEVEQPAEPTAENTASGDAEEDADDYNTEAEVDEEDRDAPDENPNLPGVKKGQVIEGTVTETSPTSVQVDLGDGAEGIIPGRELERMNRETLDLLKPGAAIHVYVINPHDHRGNIVLSVNRALEELDWQQAETYRANQEVYESRVAGYNKGGLIVRFGRVRGFVPQSQISTERRAALDGKTPEERWGEMVNEVITVKVMEVDRSRNRLILSERAAAREVRESRKEALISELKVGEIRTGRVVSLVDFGAFIDVGGAEGLVHLTELSYQHVTHPRDLLKVGEEVKVEVISVDPNRKRIGLSMKSLAADPWDMVAIEYNIGQLVQGKITKLTKFGAFAQLVDAPEIEGLVHISELSDQRVNHPREVVEEGDTLTLRVVKMDIQNRRLGLSLKKVNSPEYLDQDWDF